MLAISALNQRVAAEDQVRRDNNRQAEKILSKPLASGETPASAHERGRQVEEAREFLLWGGGFLDPQIHDELLDRAYPDGGYQSNGLKRAIPDWELPA